MDFVELLRLKKTYRDRLGPSLLTPEHRASMSGALKHYLLQTFVDLREEGLGVPIEDYLRHLFEEAKKDGLAQTASVVATLDVVFFDKELLTKVIHQNAERNNSIEVRILGEDFLTGYQTVSGFLLSVNGMHSVVGPNDMLAGLPVRELVDAIEVSERESGVNESIKSKAKDERELADKLVEALNSDESDRILHLDGEECLDYIIAGAELAAMVYNYTYERALPLTPSPSQS